MVNTVVGDALEFGSIVERFLAAMQKLDEDQKMSDWWRIFSNYRNRIEGTADFLSRIDDRFEELHQITLRFGGRTYMNYGGKDVFQENIDALKSEWDEVKAEVQEYIQKLDEEESLRIDEAYHTLFRHCFWSSIVNSAVALEKRLFEILKSRNKKFLLTKDKDLRFSFGYLIGIYLDNKSKFNTCIPKHHEKLLSMVNDYRIISAHFKQSDINRATADAIFNLTLLFLLDEKCVPVKKGRKPESS